MRRARLLAGLLPALAGCLLAPPYGAAPRQEEAVAQLPPRPEAPPVAAAPLRPEPAVPAPDAIIKLEPGSDRLSEEMEALLAEIAARARADERILLRLESYVPEGGSASVNLLRAEQSLQVVRRRLVELAINPRRILLSPFGGEYAMRRDDQRHWVEIYLIRPRL